MCVSDTTKHQSYLFWNDDSLGFFPRSRVHHHHLLTILVLNQHLMTWWQLQFPRFLEIVSTWSDHLVTLNHFSKGAVIQLDKVGRFLLLNLKRRKT